MCQQKRPNDTTTIELLLLLSSFLSAKEANTECLAESFPGKKAKLDEMKAAIIAEDTE